jgi:hypothetical protein
VKSTLSPEAIKRLAALACRSDDDAPTVIGAMALPVEMFGDYLRQRAKIETDLNVGFDLERIATEVEAMQHHRAALLELIARKDSHAALLKDTKATTDQFIASRDAYFAAWAAARAAVGECHCEACDPMITKPGEVFPSNLRMIVCAICGNKRCPHATNHRNACTASNAPGQKGSAYE